MLFAAQPANVTVPAPSVASAMPHDLSQSTAQAAPIVADPRSYQLMQYQQLLMGAGQYFFVLLFLHFL